MHIILDKLDLHVVPSVIMDHWIDTRTAEALIFLDKLSI